MGFKDLNIPENTVVLRLECDGTKGNRYVTDGKTSESVAALVELDSFLGSLNDLAEATGARTFSSELAKLAKHLSDADGLKMTVTTALVDGVLVHEFDFSVRKSQKSHTEFSER